MHCPELDGNKRKQVEHARNYCIVQCPGSVNPYSYPCHHVRVSDLWCRGRRDVKSDEAPPSYTNKGVKEFIRTMKLDEREALLEMLASQGF